MHSSSLRTTRHLAFLQYYVISNIALFILGQIIGIFGLLFAINVVLPLIYRRRVAKLFVSTTDCYNCGAGIDLDQVTSQCGCGFRSAGGHVFDACSQCGNHADMFPCPGCQVSLLT